MKILVTGATGFLGGSLVARLIQNGCTDLRCLVRSEQKATRLEAHRGDHPGIQIKALPGNLLAPETLDRAVSGVDTIYHLAAALAGSPSDIWLHTVVGSKNLLAAAMNAGVRRIVLASSFSVYGVTSLKKGGLLDEDAPLEAYPVRRDAYAFAKIRQERLFRDSEQKGGFELVVVRPGVIYGPGGGRFSTRVGISLPGLLLHVGNRNQLPLTYVDNCAEAIVVAGNLGKAGAVLNVVDDEIPTCRQYLTMYRSEVEALRYLTLPFAAAKLLGRGMEWYNRYSEGQLPAILTPYKVESLWKRTRFTNARLKALGWKQLVPTCVGLQRTFEYFKSTKTKPL